MERFFAALSDEALCLQATQGNVHAEEALILRYGRVVRACARPLFLVGGDSEDLIQEGMLGLLDAIRQFDPQRDAAFRTFAEVCVRNRLRSAVRADARSKHQPLNFSVSLDEAEGESALPLSPEEMMIDRESRQERLARLSPFENQVLSLYLTGVSYEDIAQRLQKSAKSVDNAVQRIRRKLARP